MQPVIVRRGPTRERLQSQCDPPDLTGRPLSFCFNLANNCLRLGDSCWQADDYAQCYVYYKRFSSLVLGQLKARNDWNDRRYRTDCVNLVAEVKEVMARLEVVAEKLDEADRQEAREKELEAARASAAASASIEADILQRDCKQGHLADTQEFELGEIAPAINVASATLQSRLSNLALSPKNLHIEAGSYPSIDDDTAYTGSRRFSGHLDTPREHQIVPSSMRKMVLPATLAVEFERLAQDNTMKPKGGIETCGILTGKLIGKTLVMSVLILPRQTATSDTCCASEEEVVFCHMLERRLITLGWIHTHPRQSCFLSSVDIHTQFGYQMMLPEAVAVVIAPTDSEKPVGTFRLEYPQGMDLIKACKKSGFHEHRGDVNIYKDVPVEWSADCPLEILDLRGS